jgi:hypothetical protein
MLLAKHDKQLLIEDERLENLNVKTKDWYDEHIQR